jgi:hypothetical protein
VLHLCDQHKQEQRFRAWLRILSRCHRFECLQLEAETRAVNTLMASARVSVAALQAEIAQLKEQLIAERCATDQLLATAEALFSVRDEQTGNEAGDAAVTQHRCCANCASSIECAAPLRKDDMLDHVFSFVGGGDHLYIAGVSRRWRGRYLQLCAHTTTCAHDKKCVTRHRSTIMSESRLQYAKANGLRWADLQMAHHGNAALICAHSLEPERVVELLGLHSAPWDSVMCEQAARYGKVDLLQRLYCSDCQWDECQVLLNASSNGCVPVLQCRCCVPVLQWLARATDPWPDDIMAEMLAAAASCDQLAAAQWLRARAAPWADAFASENYADSDSYEVSRECWCVSAVQWAIASGSGWPDWKCEDYDAGKYTADRQQQANDVLNWAHANGCPCTCEPLQR